MANLKLSIIFCVLLISVGVKSAHVLSEVERFKHFSAALGKLEANQELPYDLMIHPNSLDRLKDTSDDFKFKCLISYESGMDENKVDYNSPDKELLKRLAYEALDITCQSASIEQLQLSLEHDMKLWQLTGSMLRDENILDFIAFSENGGMAKPQLKRAITMFQKKPSPFPLNEFQAKAAVIVSKYTKGPFAKKRAPPPSKTGRKKVGNKKGKASN